MILKRMVVNFLGVGGGPKSAVNVFCQLVMLVLLQVESHASMLKGSAL